LWIAADEFFGTLKWPEAAPRIRIKTAISAIPDESDDCRCGCSGSYRLHPIRTGRKIPFFYRAVPDRRNGICLRLPDDVLQYHIPESRWPMRLQHATEKRNRFKNTGSYRCRNGFWPGKNHFPEKSVDFAIYRPVIRYPLIGVIKGADLNLSHQILTDLCELVKVKIEIQRTGVTSVQEQDECQTCS
jgi:hypothetical protein